MKKAIVIGLAVLALIAGAVPWFLHSRDVAQRNACINNLRMVDCVQTCCAPLANRWGVGTKMDLSMCAAYMKGNTIPVCPVGGTLISTWIVGGPPPRCSIHGGMPGASTDPVDPAFTNPASLDVQQPAVVERL